AELTADTVTTEAVSPAATPVPPADDASDAVADPDGDGSSLADAPTLSGADAADALSFDSTTLVADRKRSPSISDADTATRLPGDEAPRPAPRRSQVPPESTPGVSRWLDAAQTEAYRQRATWLEEEARAVADPIERSRC